MNSTISAHAGGPASRRSPELSGSDLRPVNTLEQKETYLNCLNSKTILVIAKMIPIISLIVTRISRTVCNCFVLLFRISDRLSSFGLAASNKGHSRASEIGLLHLWGPQIRGGKHDLLPQRKRSASRKSARAGGGWRPMALVIRIQSISDVHINTSSILKISHRIARRSLVTVRVFRTVSNWLGLLFFMVHSSDEGPPTTIQKPFPREPEGLLHFKGPRIDPRLTPGVTPQT